MASALLQRCFADDTLLDTLDIAGNTLLQIVFLLGVWAIARHMRRIDEYLRQTTLESVAIAANPAIDPNWWTLFDDATLNDLVDQALTSNADMRQAVARVSFPGAQFTNTTA